MLALALAVPLQGFAAVSAGMCMALGHHDSAPAHPHNAHDGHDASAHQHGEDHSQPADGSAHCPPCVSCCAAASISSAVPFFVGDAPADRLIAASTSFAAGFQPDGLFRPPLAL